MTTYELPDTDWAKRIFLRVEVGSTAHGTGLPGKEDYDEIAVMSIPKEDYICIPIPSQKTETIIHRPGRGPHEKSGPGDWDLTVYAVRKFMALAAQGNPSILVALFGPVVQADEFGQRLVEMAKDGAFRSISAKNRFLGYAESQRNKLESGLTGKRVKRPWLMDEFGFDTKYAMHMVRLGFQGIEFMETGSLKLPIPFPQGEILRDIRMGKIHLDDILLLAQENEAYLKEMTDAPEEPDYKSINKFLMDLFER